jgi:hypothetical protein
MIIRTKKHCHALAKKKKTLFESGLEPETLAAVSFLHQRIWGGQSPVQMLNLRRDNHGRRQLASLDAYRAAESQARPGGRGGAGGGSSAGNGVLSSAEKANAAGVGGGGGAGSSGLSNNSGVSPSPVNELNGSVPAARPQLPPPSLLEYEALALRVAPPEISVDNVSRAAATVITIDSANRPGTLVSVVEFLTARGLDVRRARISSDGGWFYDGESRRKRWRGGERGKARIEFCPRSTTNDDDATTATTATTSAFEPSWARLLHFKFDFANPEG